MYDELAAAMPGLAEPLLPGTAPEGKRKRAAAPVPPPVPPPAVAVQCSSVALGPSHGQVALCSAA